MASADAVEVAIGDGVRSVIVRGEFDLLLHDRFVAEALQGCGALEVDLSQVTFLDSAGIRALVDVATGVRAQQRGFRVVDASVVARQVIEICVLEDLLAMGAPEAC